MTVRERVAQLLEVWPEVYPDAHCELGFQKSAGAANCDNSFGPVHGQAREHGHAGIV